MAKKQAKPKKNATKNATRKPARKPAKTPKKEAKNKPKKQTEKKASSAKKTNQKAPPKQPAPKKKVNPLVGKVGWCSGETLGLSKGHYVFIRSEYDDKCSVNTFTSLKTEEGKYKLHKIKNIEEGIIYPIPSQDTTLKRFSGVHKNVITDIPISKVENVGSNSLERKHHHYIQKYMDK